MSVGGRVGEWVVVCDREREREGGGEAGPQQVCV